MEHELSLDIVNPKKTTQKSPLERLLNNLRTRQVRRWVRGKVVLDFGCGAHLSTLRSIAPYIAKGYGYDILFDKLPPQSTPDGLEVFGRIKDLPGDIECITSLAVFEHIEEDILPEVLRDLASSTKPSTIILGTVPTPPSKPVLEALSKVGLVDRSQILDHKVYYDRHLLEKTVKLGGWEVAEYRRFQLGMNSFFRLAKVGSQQ